jgi:hypothetical protein
MPGFGRGPQVDLAARVIKKPFVAVQVSNYPLRPSRALAGAGKAKCTSRSGSPAAAEERACDNEPCDLPVFERTRSHSASPPRQQRARLLPRVSLAARSSTSSLGHHRRRHHSELDSIESGGREGSEEKLLASTVPGKAAKWRVAGDAHSRSVPSLTFIAARQMAPTALVQPTTRPGGIRFVNNFSNPLPTESAREGDLAGIFGDELQARLARKMKEVEAQRAADREDTVKQKPRRRMVTTASPGSQRAAQASQLLKLSPAQQSRSPVEPKVTQRRRSLMGVGPGMDKCDRVKDAMLRKVERQTNQCFREMFAGLPEDELDVEIHRMFYSFDSNGNMRLNKDELSHAFDVMGLRLSSEQLDATFEELDHNGNGTIEADEFCRMVRERESPVSRRVCAGRH